MSIIMLYNLKHSRRNFTFLATVHSLYPLKTSENLWFSGVFKGIERDHWHETD